MTITNGYCTLSELQYRLGRSQNANDVYLDSLENAIESASRHIDKVTGQIFYSKSISSEYIDIYMSNSNNGFYINDIGNKIYCPAPIISASGIYSDDALLVENTDYFLNKSDGVIRADSCFSTNNRGILVTSITVGHSSTPDDIKQTCLTLAEIYSGLGKTTIQDYEGNLQEIRKNTVPKSVYDILNKYRWINL